MCLFLVIHRKKIIYASVGTLCAAAVAIVLILGTLRAEPCVELSKDKKYIKWVDFSVSYEALSQALAYDVESHGSDTELDWIELLSYAAAKNGGRFNAGKSDYIDELAKKLHAGGNVTEITKNMKYYKYYYEAYSAVLDGFVGEYTLVTESSEGKKSEMKYGLQAFFPLAKGYSYSHFDDFGNSRSYGFRRLHLGHDLMGNIGTPVIAVEGGVIEAVGWNRYGGWRIGIRSHNKKRYYYYAHLRRNHPYKGEPKVGDEVLAGEVIGYLGMTGYSTKENVNNIDTPHLHFGIQLIFDESQKDGNNEIWIDCYSLTRLLSKNRSLVRYNEGTKEHENVTRVYPAGSE